MKLYTCLPLPGDGADGGEEERRARRERRFSAVRRRVESCAYKNGNTASLRSRSCCAEQRHASEASTPGRGRETADTLALEGTADEDDDDNEEEDTEEAEDEEGGEEGEEEEEEEGAERGCDGVCEAAASTN